MTQIIDAPVGLSHNRTKIYDHDKSYACTHACLYIHIYIYTIFSYITCVYIYISIYIYIYIIYIYMHTYLGYECGYSPVTIPGMILLSLHAVSGFPELCEQSSEKRLRLARWCLGWGSLALQVFMG